MKKWEIRKCSRAQGGGWDYYVTRPILVDRFNTRYELLRDENCAWLRFLSRDDAATAIAQRGGTVMATMACYVGVTRSGETYVPDEHIESLRRARRTLREAGRETCVPDELIESPADVESEPVAPRP